jgi:hypothetical protein
MTDYFAVTGGLARAGPQVMEPVTPVFINDVGPEPLLIGQLWPRGNW